MSVYALIIGFALSGQLAGDNRYDTSPGETASAAEPPADGGNSSAERGLRPPPPFKIPTETPPPATAEDLGHRNSATEPKPPPAASSPPASSRQEEAKPSVKPSTMMRAMMAPPAASRLSGEPTRLADVLAGAATRDEQSQRIDAYWDLCSAVADYYLGIEEQDELQRLRSRVANVGPAWQQAEAELGVRIGTSERAAVASQYRLADFLGGVNVSALPLPADLPHCGDYYARYDQVFAGRQSPEAQQLSELLPMRYNELCDAAMAVTRAEEFLQAVASQPGGDGTGTLRALELVALRRRAFVQIARDYNCRIARYAELAAPGPIDTERLIGMLIRRDDSANTATRPATPPVNRQSRFPAERPTQTFADGWESAASAATATRDENVKPAAAEAKSAPRREHSLLVPSR